MTDIIETLRRHAMITEEVGCGSDQGRKIAPVTMREAAEIIEQYRADSARDERVIERLRAQVDAAREFVKRHPALTLIDLAEFEVFLKVPAMVDAALSSTDSNPTGNIEGGAT